MHLLILAAVNVVAAAVPPWNAWSVFNLCAASFLTGMAVASKAIQGRWS